MDGRDAGGGGRVVVQPLRVGCVLETGNGHAERAQDGGERLRGCMPADAVHVVVRGLYAVGKRQSPDGPGRGGGGTHSRSSSSSPSSGMAAQSGRLFNS